MSRSGPGIVTSCAAELVGTFILIFLGCGAVHTAVVLGAFEGSGQVATVWGFAVALAVYAVGNVSGAHINPAVSVALAVWGRFPAARVLPYVLSQLSGAALAALVLHVAFSDSIEAFEATKGIVRGAPGSELTASMYGEYFPNPGVALHVGAGGMTLGTGGAFLIELVATALLGFCVFAFTDERNRGGPGAKLAPFFIGMVVFALVAVFGPMTQCCLNPARDFGPRIVAYFAGWGDIAFSSPDHQSLGATLAVYLVAPVAGGVVGGALWCLLFGPRQPASTD